MKIMTICCPQMRGNEIDSLSQAWYVARGCRATGLTVRYKAETTELWLWGYQRSLREVPMSEPH